ncbi:MAG: hypothetical protein G3M70_07095 [Candidatus Nitronauta litoralis]|uniref:HTH cro/C1-type domain-containing protein n=1 Tax=Candidatus Nitronauta litoralis TaxID=2705533 RepID=A0A7T0BVN2_9BACT|nr:MAG: hypothetical protein G3M70_07095 [Candidatus Nitronauta litoralis]
MNPQKKYIKEKRDGLQVWFHLKKRGYSMADVGRATGKTRSAVHQVIYGKRNSKEILDFIESIGVPKKHLGVTR